MIIAAVKIIEEIIFEYLPRELILIFAELTSENQKIIKIGQRLNNISSPGILLSFFST